MSHLLGLLSGVLKALAVVGACVALALACFWSYRKTTKSISFGWRGFLGFLRVVAVALVLLCLFQPSFERREAITEKANVVLLVDCSRSMEIADEAGGMTRAAATQACLERNRKRLEVLAEQYQMRRYQFAREMEKLDETAAVGVDRDVTALGDALMVALREMKGQRAAGVLIFGDGATNYGMDAEPVAQLYHDQSIPIYAVGFGKTRGAALTRDVRAENIRCARSVFARNVLPVTAEFLAVGCAGLAVTIELKFDGKVVDRQQVNIKNADETLRVSFEFSPEEVGAHKVSVAAVPVERETVMTNNETSTFVNVLEGGVKVAYFEAKPRIEQKFLKRSIEAAGGVELKPFLVLGQAAPVKGRAAWQPTYDWATYDAVIFGDITVSAFSSVDQRTLKDAVEKKGVGFMMIGGFQNFGAGGYVGTPVADLLPVKISPADKQSDEAFRLQPGTAAMGSFILRIADTPAQSERSWVALPELRGFVGVSGVKPAAHVLATDGRGAPILVVQQFGKGRTGAFMADTTWRWAFADPESADKGAQAADWSECHRRFWRQLILWLAGKDSAGKDRVWLVLNKFRFQRGEPVVVTAHVEDPSGNPIPNVEVDGTL
ncbi:MAG: hypothetical protein FJ279_29010, partial [Planctomycetes bacterium]|nr:hypothetical protein [Planctomycetota bacterium]